MKIAGRGFEVRVAQQGLNHEQVHSLVQQVCGKRVPQGVIVVLIISFPLRSSIVITRAMEQKSNLFAI